MKLSTLYEARDPKKEAEWAPILSAPFKSYWTRRKEGEELEKLKPKPSEPEPEFHSDDTFGGHTARNYPKTQNVDSAATLQKAINYWVQNFNGERWPTLEQAFLNRAWTFKGGMSAYNTARSSLFKYLNNLNAEWPEGEAMAAQTLSGHRGIEYISGYRTFPEVERYVKLRPTIPGLVTRIQKALKDYEARVEDWKIKHAKWEAQPKNPPQGLPSTFYEPRKPHWPYGNIEWFQQYAAGQHVPEPKEPKPYKSATPAQRKRKRHPSDYPEHLRQTPPFAGWA